MPKLHDVIINGERRIVLILTPKEAALLRPVCGHLELDMITDCQNGIGQLLNKLYELLNIEGVGQWNAFGAFDHSPRAGAGGSAVSGLGPAINMRWKDHDSEA